MKPEHQDELAKDEVCHCAKCEAERIQSMAARIGGVMHFRGPQRTPVRND